LRKSKCALTAFKVSGIRPGQEAEEGLEPRDRAAVGEPAGPRFELALCLT